MNEKKIRLNLDELKVQSFVTTLDPAEQAQMYGMVETGPLVCAPTGPRECGDTRPAQGCTGPTGCWGDTAIAGCGDTTGGCTTNEYCYTTAPGCDYTYDLGCP